MAIMTAKRELSRPSQYILSSKRPSVTLKRNYRDEDMVSPTSADEVDVISPKKKVTSLQMKTECGVIWPSPRSLENLDKSCMKVLEAYSPVPIDNNASPPFDDEECEILQFFLS